MCINTRKVANTCINRRHVAASALHFSLNCCLYLFDQLFTRIFCRLTHKSHAFQNRRAPKTQSCFTKTKLTQYTQKCVRSDVTANKFEPTDSSGAREREERTTTLTSTRRCSCPLVANHYEMTHKTHKANCTCFVVAAAAVTVVVAPRRLHACA